jgi:hypothetical protein
MVVNTGKQAEDMVIDTLTLQKYKNLEYASKNERQAIEGPRQGTISPHEYCDT